MTPEERLERIDAEIERRIRLLAKIESDGLRGIALALDHYEHHPVEWVNDFVWSFDPRNKRHGLPLYVPFKLAPIQVELLEWRRWLRAEGKNGWIPKSRATGASYIACSDQLHSWLFGGAFAGSMASMKEEEVDERDDPDSLFQKLRIVLQFLPSWMLPDGWDGVNGRYDNHRRLVNPETGANITGKIGRNSGRGGRRELIDLDEAAHITGLKTIRRAVYQASDTVIETSTYNGIGEPFYKRASDGGPRVFRIHWSDIPFYGEEWYAQQKQKYKYDPVGLAQEVDMDPTAAVEDICIPGEWVRACVEWEPDDSSRAPRVAGLDVAGGGSNLNVFTPRIGNRILQPKTKSEGNTTRTAWWSRDACEEFGLDELHYDDVGIGSGVGDTLTASEERLRFDVRPFVANDTPSSHRWPSGKTSKERFRDLKAECWWRFRVRCKNTFEVAEGIADHPVEDCIGLPDCPELTEQLSQPKYYYTSTGKIRIESKDELQDRGIESPDYAESAVMTEAHFAKPSQDTVIEGFEVMPG